jgi:hypothetical protein
MNKLRVVAGTFAAIVTSALAVAHDSDVERYATRLSSYNETPAVSSVASGRFTATVDEASQSITFELRYEGLEGAVQQAHVHFGSPFLNGGISFFLCSNLGNGPAGTLLCPVSPGTVSGTITAAAVIGPGTTPEVNTATAGQGISAGQFNEILRAIRAGVAYANVHSVKFPGGEIRGQLKRVRGRGDKDD